MCAVAVAEEGFDVRVAAPGSRFGRSRVVHLPLPFGATRADNEHLFLEHARLESVVEGLRATSGSPVLAADPAFHDGSIQLEKNNEHT